MTRKCVSLRTADFLKCLKSLGKKKAAKLEEKIAELERMENDHSLVPEGKNSAESVLGKRLLISKNTFALEFGYDRALAVVIEKNGKKIFAWFWSGSHEEYNKKLKASNLHKNENNINNTQNVEISEKFKILESIGNIRDKANPNNGNGLKNN